MPPLTYGGRDYVLVICLIPSLPCASSPITQVFFEQLPLSHSQVGARDTAVDKTQVAPALKWLTVQ